MNACVHVVYNVILMDVGVGWQKKSGTGAIGRFWREPREHQKWDSSIFRGPRSSDVWGNEFGCERGQLK